MKVYLFNCTKNRKIVGISNDQKGSNLPKDDCKGVWEYWKDIDVNSGDKGRVGAPSNEEILDAINQNGYLIAESDVLYGEDS